MHQCLAQSRVQNLLINTGCRATVHAAFIAFANSIVIIRRLARQAWTTHRWQTRPQRIPEPINTRSNRVWVRGAWGRNRPLFVPLLREGTEDQTSDSGLGPLRF